QTRARSVSTLLTFRLAKLTSQPTNARTAIAVSASAIARASGMPRRSAPFEQRVAHPPRLPVLISEKLGTRHEKDSPTLQPLRRRVGAVYACQHRQRLVASRVQIGYRRLCLLL